MALRTPDPGKLARGEVDPDTPEAWIFWILAAFFVLYQFLLQGSTSVMEQSLLRDLYISDAGFGWLASTFYYPYLLLQVPAGILVTRYGPRRLMTVGLLTCAVASVLFGLAPEFTVAEVARFLMGVGAAPAVVSALTLAARWFHGSKFALFAGLTEMLGALGGAVGQELLAAMVEALGWRHAMLGSGLIGLALAVVAGVIIRDRPRWQKVLPRAAAREQAGVRAVLFSRALWMTGVIGGLLFSVGLAFAMLWGVPFLQQKLGGEVDRAALATSCYFWGLMIGLPLAGSIADRWSRRAVQLLSAVTSLAVLLALLLAPFTDLWMAALLMGGLGFFGSGYVVAFALGKDLAPTESKSVALAFINMVVMAVGGWFLQPLVGLLVAGGWPIERAVLLFPGALFVALLLILFAFPRSESRLPPREPVP